MHQVVLNYPISNQKKTTKESIYRIKYYLFTGGWVVVSDEIEVWFISFVCEGDIGSKVSVTMEEEEGSDCLVWSVIRCWEGNIVG